MDAEARAAGRLRVRELLIDRLALAGMVRPKGVTLEAHSDMMKRLAERLAYMASENLITLSELVIEAAQGSTKNVWPVEATVINMANNLERCPPSEHRIIHSWFASIEGPKAVAAGVEVGLYLWLTKYRRPPVGGVDNRMIAEEERKTTHNAEMIRDRIERDVATVEDRDWLKGYIAMRDHVRRIIEAGQAKRVAA